MATSPARQGTARKAAAPKRKLRLVAPQASRTEAAEQFDPGESLRGYDGDYLMCRDPAVRHRWDLVGYWENGPIVMRRLACDRCGTIKHQGVHRNGLREPSRYEYPDDYKIGGKVTNADLVVEELNRVRVYASETTLMKALMTQPRKKR